MNSIYSLEFRSNGSYKPNDMVLKGSKSLKLSRLVEKGFIEIKRKKSAICEKRNRRNQLDLVRRTK